MTPEDERQRAWREAVRAFRLTAAAFEDPAPGLLAELTGSEEGFRDLTQELPLVGFSPFGVLPDDVAYGRGAEPHRPAAVAGRTTGRAIERETAGFGAARNRTSRPPGSLRDLPVTSPHAAESADQPPIFSFRRGSASDVPAGQQPSQRSQEMREHPASAGEPFRAPESGSADSRREGPEAVETPPDASSQSEATTDDLGVELGREVKRPGAQEHCSVHPMDLLDGLAEDALKAAEQLTLDVPVRQSRVPTSRSAHSDGRAVRSREPDRKIERGHGAAERASGEPGSPRFVTASQSPVGSLLDPVKRRNPDPPAMSLGGSPESALQTTPDNSAVALIDSLTEHLLAPGAQFAGGLPTSSEARDGRVEGSVVTHPWEEAEEEAILHRSPADFLDGAQEKSAGPSGSEQLDESWIAETSFERHMDAETFASLVNDVLVRQARRHGVDLL